MFMCVCVRACVHVCVCVRPCVCELSEVVELFEFAPNVVDTTSYNINKPLQLLTV